MDVIKFEDQDGKPKFILEGDSTEPVPVVEEVAVCPTTIRKPEEEQK